MLSLDYGIEIYFKAPELYKKKIGILGLGRLGEIVAKYADVFGMEVYYFDIAPKQTNSVLFVVDQQKSFAQK